MKRLFRWIWKSQDENSPTELEEKDIVLQNMSWSQDEIQDGLSKSLFNTIPNEIILHIFRFLSVRDLCTISLVCRSFKIIVDCDEIWKTKCNTSIKLYSKSYKQLYVEWMQKKCLCTKNILAYQNYCRHHRPCCIYQPYSFPRRSINKHKSTCGFNQYPNSTEELTIELLIDIDQTTPELISLWENASHIHEQCSQTIVLKQMIQRYYRFMQLKASNAPNILLIPTLDIEIVWQTHLLRPEIYRNDCLRLFYRIIDHSLTIKDEIEQCFKEQAFLDTCQLYEQIFGEKYCTLPMNIKEKNVISHNDYRSVCIKKPIYCYWNQTYFDFSSNLSNDYENPFSFTENDIIHDGKWLNLWKENMFNGYQFSKKTRFCITPDVLKDFKRIYERFLYMTANKHPLNNINSSVSFAYSVDFMWHLHIQEPLNYESDCLRLVGHLISSSPSINC
ncbi:unnamed protein product [Adineta steineri]|uniref:F-box domain-containing protein n=1 Tax=Adineta steineri TaxID=433720 RepID=A0A818TEH7_9BILA|nr:unnamed protein product [Adineta steineri]CAF3676340.1 unnamed protein product [Adineta steineri]